jgi:recombination protein RecA
VEFDILYGEGISRTGDVLDLAVDRGIVDKSGAWFSYSGDRIGQGRENSRIFLNEHPTMLAEIEAKLLEQCGLGPKQEP